VSHRWQNGASVLMSTPLPSSLAFGPLELLPSFSSSPPRRVSYARPLFEASMFGLSLFFSVFMHLQYWHSHLPLRTVVIVSSQPLILVRRSPESPTLHVLFLRHFSFHCLSSEILLLAEDLPEAAVKARPTTSKLPPASVSSSCLSVIFFSPLFLIQRSRILAAPPLFHLLVV
jgi:hypothetical protein